MRVSPIGYGFNSIENALREAKKYAEVSHNYPEGIKGAQATALGVYLAWNGYSKTPIREEILKRFGNDQGRRLSEIRPRHHFDLTCHGFMPEALIAFLDSKDYEGRKPKSK